MLYCIRWQDQETLKSKNALQGADLPWRTTGQTDTVRVATRGMSPLANPVQNYTMEAGLPFTSWNTGLHDPM